MKKTAFALFLSFWLFGLAHAQTQPQPHDLSTGNFSFTEWDSLSAAQTYPPSMYFHRVDTQNPTDSDTATGDWDCIYNLMTGCWIKGKAGNGISFRNIGTAQTDNCQQGGGTNNGGYVGIAATSLNTTLRQNIQVSWVGRMLSDFTYNLPTGGPGGGNPVNRFYGIKCQYRIGETGVFTDLPADSLFLCNASDTSYFPEFYADTLGPVLLPVSCENQPVVQIRWIYYQTNNGSGPRPELGLDDILITSDITTGIHSNQNLKSEAGMIRQNPVSDKILRMNKSGLYNIYSATGQHVSTFSGSEIQLSHFKPGIYLVRNQSGNTDRFILE